MLKTPLVLTLGILTAGLSGFAADKFDFNKLDLGKLPPPSAQKGLTFEKDIKPMFRPVDIAHMKPMGVKLDDYGYM